MFARRSIFLPHFQVHGLFVASMFGGILGSEFPGSIYMMQNLLFKAPCYVGSSDDLEKQLAQARSLLKIRQTGVAEFCSRV